MRGPMSDLRLLLRGRRGLATDALLFLVFAAAGLHYTKHLQASGDEPHYLLMTQSLLLEGDLDLRDNYAREDFLEYTPAPLAPHYAAPRTDGRPYPAHSPGLPVLLAPAYAVAGRRGCVVMLALLAAWLAREVRRLAMDLTEDAGAASVAWAAAAGPPVFFYSFHAYTEVPSGLALALSLRLLLRGGGVQSAAAAALLACLLPWLHVKMALAAAVLGVIAAMRRSGRALAAFLAVAAIGATAFVGYYFIVFGRLTPLAIYGGVPRDMTSSSPLRASIGLLLDRSFGLLPYAPAYLLALAGAPALARRGPRVWAPLLAVGLAVVLPLLGWRMWWGGLCPPARFLVPLVPVLGATIACAASEGRGLLVRLRWPLIAAGWALAFFMVWRPEDRLLLNRPDRPTRLWEYVAPEAGRWLPSLASTEPRDVVLAGGWGLAVAALLVLDRGSRRDRGGPF